MSLQSALAHISAIAGWAELKFLSGQSAGCWKWGHWFIEFRPRKDLPSTAAQCHPIRCCVVHLHWGQHIIYQQTVIIKAGSKVRTLGVRSLVYLAQGRLVFFFCYRPDFIFFFSWNAILINSNNSTTFVYKSGGWSKGFLQHITVWCADGMGMSRMCVLNYSFHSSPYSLFL